MQGRVKWFNEKKGFGFLEQDEKGTKDVFVHYQSIQGQGFKTLKENDRVTFEVKQTERGPSAVDVKVI